MAVQRRPKASGREDGVDTRGAILDASERLVQRRGFNGFSYADVALELGITKAALHYHFPGKAELGESLINRYAERFAEGLASIDTLELSALSKLEAYCDIYRRVLADERMCLCGMLAAEYPTLAPTMRDAVERFFVDNEAWVAALLESGRAERSLEFSDSAHDAARVVIAALEGAMLVARPHGDSAVFEAVVTRLTLDFAPTAAS